MRVGNDRYILDELLAQGGVASVYRGTDTQTGELRAIKVLRLQDDGNTVVRLEHEARLMRRLEHPNVLDVYELGHEGDTHYIVMELADCSVADAVEEAGKIDPAQAVRWMLDVLSALDAAHAEEVIHRDVKPQNLLLCHGGRVKLADFGIALVASAEERATDVHALLGSGVFMPPEQAEDARSVGPQADIYAVATTLFYLLTGGNPLGLYDAGENSPRWHGVPEPLVPILQKAAHRTPRLRYTTATAMARALRSVDLENLEAADRSERFTAPMRPQRATRNPAEAIEVARTVARLGPADTAPPPEVGRPWGVMAIVLLGLALVAVAASMILT